MKLISDAVKTKMTLHHFNDKAITNGFMALLDSWRYLTFKVMYS